MKGSFTTRKGALYCIVMTCLCSLLATGCASKYGAQGIDVGIQVAGIAGEADAVVPLVVVLGDEIARPGPGSRADGGPGQSTFRLPGLARADDRAEQGTHRSAHDHCGVEALFGAAQIGDGLVAVGIVMHVRRLRAVFAGAAAEQGDARHCHDQKSEMTLDHVDLLGWMHGVSLFP